MGIDKNYGEEKKEHEVQDCRASSIRTAAWGSASTNQQHQSLRSDGYHYPATHMKT
jgi:hypothetical protein